MAGEPWTPAYVGLGSNLDNPPAQLRRALAALARLPETRRVASSGFYWNPPMGPPGQPDYLNAVAGLLTLLSPPALLAELRQIEAAQGRERDGPHWGPRTLDLDLLLHGQTCSADESLALPHPGIADRPFVLVPLAEVAPGLRLPDGREVARLAAACGAAGLVRVAD
jgi:2-amino-4-hydroxy-6-hydroxymethyldihydropteridine diphosphokinase